jgi:hypothetical protein
VRPVPARPLNVGPLFISDVDQGYPEYWPGLRDRLVGPRDRLVGPRDRLVAPRGRLVAPRDRLVASRGRLVAPRGRLVAPRGRLVAPRDRLVAPRDRLVRFVGGLFGPADGAGFVPASAGPLLPGLPFGMPKLGGAMGSAMRLARGL